MAAKITVGTPKTIFERTGATYQDTRGYKPLPMRPEDYATKAQLYRLRTDGIPIPPKCSKRAFQRLLATNNKRKAKGLCQLGGVEFLRKYGYDAWNLSSESARRLAEAVVTNLPSKLTAEQVAAAVEREVGADDI